MTINKDRILSIGFGFSLIYWGVIGFFINYQGWETPIVRLFITLLNITVGILILFRSPVINYGSFSAVFMSLPSLLCGGLAFKLSKDLSSWGFIPICIFLLGGGITLISFLFLGKSFSVFPSLRGIVSKGSYRLVRHPSYFGELLMIIACLIATDYIFSWSILLLFFPFIILRIEEEEKLLSTSEEYISYSQKVTWRLIPLIW